MPINLYIHNPGNKHLDAPLSIVDLTVQRNVLIPPGAQVHVILEDQKAFDAASEYLSGYGVKHSKGQPVAGLRVIHAAIVAPAKGK